MTTSNDALRDAFARDDLNAFRAALETGANPNLLIDGNPLLMIAVFGDQPEMVDELIKRGADLNAKGFSGFNALSFLAWTGLEPQHADAAAKLIKAGANVNTADNTGATAVERAAQFGNRAVFDLLKEAGATVSARASELIRDAEARKTRRHGQGR